jgi:hypothetical protein
MSGGELKAAWQALAKVKFRAASENASVGLRPTFRPQSTWRSGALAGRNTG